METSLNLEPLYPASEWYTLAGTKSSILNGSTSWTATCFRPAYKCDLATKPTTLLRIVNIAPATYPTRLDKLRKQQYGSS
jgi:hypothetical protein